MCGFVSDIQMDAYAYEHSPEQKMVFSTYFQMLQAVVVKDTVIKPLTGGTFAVYCFIFFGIPWDSGMETQVAVILYVNGAPVTSGGTFLLMRAGIHTPTFQGAAVFVCILYGIVAPWAHFLPGRAEGRACFIKSDVCGGIWG